MPRGWLSLLARSREAASSGSSSSSGGKGGGRSGQRARLNGYQDVLARLRGDGHAALLGDGAEGGSQREAVVLAVQVIHLHLHRW